MSTSPMESALTNGDPHREFADLLADIAEVFAHRVDADGATSLLHACLEMSGSTDGTVYLDDIAGRLTVAATTLEASPESPSPAVTRALVSMRAEATNEGNDTVHAFPLRSRGHVIGVVELYSRHRHAFDSGASNAVQALADVAAATIEHVRTLEQTARLVGQLQNALDHRVVVEQAKGVLAERLGVDCHAAFHELRNTARREQKPVSDIASAVVAGRTNGNLHI